VSVLDRFRLDGRVAIVTGASSGLGVDLAIGLAGAGADVTVCARRVDRLELVRERVEARGRRCLSVEADVTSVEDCDRVVGETMSEFGRVDILVNNAGLGGSYPATHEPPAHFRRVLDVNLNGTYWMAQACGRVMQPGSSIVNLSSVLALTTEGVPLAAYSASKAAVIGLTRDLAQQWTGRKGIRVNALAPGFFPSEMTDGYLPEQVERTIGRIPMKRFGEADELTAALLFLASDAGSYVSGTVLVVDGGLLTA
jgi:NAD(P)-dependent dehydrogenase (short-subunit alcohol dehydrogenase family)